MLIAKEFRAIEIDSRDVWEILQTLVPHLSELSFEDNHGSFFVLTPEEKYGWMLCTPQTIAEHFDHITPNPLCIKLVNVIK